MHDPGKKKLSYLTGRKIQGDRILSLNSLDSAFCLVDLAQDLRTAQLPLPTTRLSLRAPTTSPTFTALGQEVGPACLGNTKKVFSDC